MSQDSFDIVFNGVMVPGSDPAQVKRNLAALFKTEVAKVEPLFSGRRFVIKKGLDEATALKYQQALREAGAIVQVENATSVTPPVNPEQTAPAAEKDGLQATVDPPGVVLVEPAKVEPPVIDTSGLSLDPPGVTLVPPAVVPELAVDLSGLSMAEPGVVLVEHPEVEELVVDVSALSLAEPGVRLVEHVPVPAPDIDTSRLALE